MPVKDHPVWGILKYAVVAGSAIGLLAILYRNGFDGTKDTATVVGILGAMGVLDLVKAFFAGDGK